MFFFNYKKKKRKVFLYVKLHIFWFFFLKRHTYHGGFRKYFIRSSKVSEYTTIAGPRKNRREVAKTTALLTSYFRRYEDLYTTDCAN